MKELEARIIALCRRKEKLIEEIISFWDISIDINKKNLKRWENILELSHKEYSIVEYLARHKGYPKNKLDILEAVWWMREAELAIDSVTLEAHISTIRKKLWKWIITTIKWTGYVIT
jgi:DNA-binding response OmpR family regulator